MICHGCALRLQRLRRLALLALVALLMPVTAHAAEPALSGPLLSPDGTQISVSGLVSKVTADYIVLRESGSRSYLIIPWTADEPVRAGQPLDATGVLATQPNGYRYLQNPQISAWLDASGAIVLAPVPVPGPAAGSQEFAGREALSEAPSKAGRSGTMSMTEDEGQGPPGGSPDDPIFCDTLQIAVDQVQNAKVKLHSRPILSVGSGSFVLGENANATVSPTQSLATSYSGTVATSERVLSIAGTLNNNPNSLVVSASSGFAHVFTAAPGSIAYAKSLPDDAAVTLGTTSTGRIVTAVLGPDVFYVEEDDRACGIRVEKTSHGRVAGERAYVAGAMKTNASHERYIQASQTSQAGEGACAPLRMINASIGGEGYYANVGPPAVGQAGITGDAGPNTVGLLVRTMGTITHIEETTPPAQPTWFELSDGSCDGVVRIDLAPAANATIAIAGAVDQFVTVTGVCSLGTNQSAVIPVLRPVAFGPITFSPAGGDYCECKTVQIIGPEPKPDMDLAIWYTIDGSDPSPENPNARLYNPAGVVVVPIPDVGNGPTTLKAVAIAGGWAQTAIYSGQYSRGSNCDEGGGGGGTIVYDYVRHHLQAPDGVHSFRVADIYEPHTIRLSWQSQHHSFAIKRVLGTAVADLGTTETAEYVDSSNFTTGSEYRYKVKGLAFIDDSHDYLTTWQDGYPESNIYEAYDMQEGGWQEITVVPARVPASEACAVDSRIDTREADPLPLDHNFAGSTYRGGLFVGRPGATDGSGVARSFLKFDLSEEEIGENEGVWAASINAVYTGSLSATTATTVGCQVLDNDNWTASSLNWSNAPPFAPQSARDPAVVGAGALSAGSWCHWSSCGISILDEMLGDGVLSAGLAATGESDPDCGWAYFAKQEYDATRPPQILYAFGSEYVSGPGDPSAPCVPIGLTLDANTVLGGLTLGGTVFLNRAAPPGGRTVHLSAGPACSATVEDVVVPAGETSARFVVPTAIVEQDEENGMVTAAVGAPGCTASFTIDDGGEE